MNIKDQGIDSGIDLKKRLISGFSAIALYAPIRTVTKIKLRLVSSL